MKTPSTLAAAAATLAVSLAPAAALAATSGHPNNDRSATAPGHTRTATTSPTDLSSMTPSQARAYGRLCRAESKKHVSGQKGTPFSKCVHDLAALDRAMRSSNQNSNQSSNSNSSSSSTRSATNPHKVCANESKKHISGHKGTPYSECVVAAAKLRSERSSSTTDSASATQS